MKIWVYLDGRQQGPFELEQLFDMPVDENTKVWFDGLPRWCAAGEIEDLRCLFDGSRPASAAKAPADADTTAPAETEAEIEADNIAAEVEAGEPSETVEPALDLEAEPHSEPSSRFAPGRRMPRRELPDEPCPGTYLGWSIALAICCCSPLSIGALVASICVTSFYQNGNVEKAKKASEIAAWLIMISIALGFFPVMFLSTLFGE